MTKWGCMQASGYVERPDYRVDVRRKRNLVRVKHEGQVIAETTASLLVDEQDHGVVFYIPQHDVRFDLLAPVDHTSRCPFKGSARYWSFANDSAPVAWEYHDPYHEVALLRGHIGFQQDRVTVEVGTANPAVTGRPTT